MRSADFGKVIAKYLDGGQGGIGGGGSRHHVFYDVEINDLEGITQSTQYDIYIWLPEFDKLLYNSNQSLHYTCASVLSTNTLSKQKLELLNLGNNQFKIEAENVADFKIKIYSLNGQIMDVFSYHANFTLGNLENGLYILEVSRNGQILLLNKAFVY